MEDIDFRTARGLDRFPAEPAQIGDPSVADSILARLVHNAPRFELSGESLRKKGSRKAGGGE